MTIKPQDLDDQLYTRMFDGRIIHHHMMFVEPHLIREHARQHAGVPHRVEGDRLPLDEWVVAAAGTGQPNAVEATPLPGPLPSEGGIRAGASMVRVIRLRENALVPADDALVERVDRLLGVLRQVGLDYLVELAVGAVIVSGQVWPTGVRPLFTATIADVGDVEDQARALLRCAAANLAWAWMIADEAIRRPGVDLWPERPYADLADLFAEEVLVDFDSRLAGQVPELTRQRWTPLRDWRPEEFLDWLDTIPGVPLAKELACVWFPHWWRAGFIMDSPFDYIRELPLPGDAVRPVREVLELSRRGMLDAGKLIIPRHYQSRSVPTDVRSDHAGGDGGAATAAAAFEAVGVTAISPLLRPLSEYREADGGLLPRLPFTRPDFNRRLVAQQLDQTTDGSSRRLDVITRQVDWLAAVVGDQIVDVYQPMCGPGLFAQAFARVGTRRYLGVDNGPASVAHARSVPGLPQGFEFDQADVRGHRPPDSAGQFDLVINTYESLNCFPVREGLELLESWARQVRSGGHLVVEVRLTDADVSGYGNRTSSHRPDGSGVESADHYLLEESALLADRSAVGHRLIALPCDSPDRVSVLYSLIWLYDIADIRKVLEPLGFTIMAHTNPAAESIDNPESLQAPFVVATRLRAAADNDAPAGELTDR
jgi:SAM-dependent methyltransferase